MTKLPLGRSHTDRTGDTGPALAVDVAVKILPAVAVRRAERTARRARQVATSIAVDTGRACAGDRGNLLGGHVEARIMVP